MSEWISVDDRLPEADGLFLVASRGAVLMDYYDSAIARMYCSPIRGFERSEPDLGGVTHWMPLPEPPKA